MSSAKVQITYEPSGRKVEVDEGTDLLEAALLNKVPISTSCNGKARCGSCLVEVLAGAENLNKIKIDEQDHITRNGYRLACRARAMGPVTVRCVRDPEE